MLKPFSQDVTRFWQQNMDNPAMAKLIKPIMIMPKKGHELTGLNRGLNQLKIPKKIGGAFKWITSGEPGQVTLAVFRAQKAKTPLR